MGTTQQTSLLFSSDLQYCSINQHRSCVYCIFFVISGEKTVIPFFCHNIAIQTISSFCAFSLANLLNILYTPHGFAKHSLGTTGLSPCFQFQALYPAKCILNLVTPMMVMVLIACCALNIMNIFPALSSRAVTWCRPQTGNTEPLVAVLFNSSASVKFFLQGFNRDS